MSVPRPAGDSAQRDQTQQQQQQQPTQATALSTTLHIPPSHAFIPLQQFSFTPTETLGLRNPSDDNNNKTVSVVAQQQQPQLPVVSVVAAVPGLCPPLPVHSMQQAVVGGTPTIIPTVMAPMTVHAAAAAAAGLPSTTMTMTNTLNIGNHLSVAAAASTAAQQYQALGNTAGLNLMTSPALNNPTALNLASSAAVASAMTSLNTSILANNANTNTSINNSPPSHSSPPSTADTKSSAKNSLSTSSNSGSSSSSNSSNSSPSNNNAKSSSNSNSSNSNTTSSKSGSSAKNSSSASSSSTSSQQGAGSSTETPDDLVKPVFKDGELVLEVECGQNKGILYLSKLCQGSKGPCISFQTSWLTPNEFQFVSGRETAKDWKRSIRHHGKSLKLLLAKGILNVHPTMCDCDGCRQGATLTRKGEKRRIPNGDRKPRKLSGGGNAGNGNSSGHAGTGVGAGAFRPVGGTPTVASHLASPGGATAKPEAKRSGGDKQLKIATAGATQSPDQSPAKNAVLSQEDLKSQASAYLDSFNMLGAHKLKPATSTPLRPLELTTSSSSADAGACELTPQSQHSPELSSPASSTSSHSGLCSPAAPSLPKPQSPSSGDRNVCGADEIAEADAAPCSPDKTLDLSTNALDCHKKGNTTTDEKSHMESSKLLLDDDKNLEDGEVVPTEKLETADSDVSSADEDSDDDEEDVEMKQDPITKEKSENMEQEEAVSEKVTSAKDNSVAGNDNSKEDPIPIDDSESKKEDDKDNKSSDVKAVPITSQTLTASSNSQTPAKQHHPYGISAILGSSFSSDSPAPTVTPSMSDSSSTAVMSGVCSHPLSVSVSSNNVKSEHIWIPPTLSPTNTGALKGQLQRSSDHHSNNNNNNNNANSSSNSCKVNAKSLPPSFSTPHPQSKAQPSSENSSIKVESSNNPNHNTHPFQKSHDTLQGPNVSPGKEQQLLAGQHGAKSSVTNSDKAVPVRRDYNALSKPERVGERERETAITTSINTNHLSSISDKTSAIRDKDKEERQKQRAKEERNRKDREREERRERERREEKETERRRHEEKERRVPQSEPVKQDGVSAAAPGLAGNPSSDPSRRPPGGLADAAAFSDYMRVLAAGHGHAMVPPGPNYMPSLYGLRPQDTAAAYSQLLHPMSMYGPAATAAAGGLPKDAASSLLFPGTAGALAGFGPSPFASLHPLLAARSQYGGAGASLLDYQRSLAAASSSSSSAPTSNSTSPYAAWPAAAYPYLLPDLMAASSPQAAAAAAAGIKRHSSEMEAAMELNAKRMRLEGRPPEFTSPWDYFAAAAAASQHHHHQQQQHQQQQQQQHQQQQQQQRAAAAFGHPALSCGLESTSSFDKNSAEYLRKRYMEYAASNPHAAAYLSALPDYARTMSVYGQVAAICPEHRDQDIRLWSVEDVCKFLTTLEGCGIYSEHFREQRVDGRILSLLSSEHLVKTLGMKLGPALLLAEAVAKRLQELTKMASCEACRAATLSSMQAMQALHPMMSLPL